ncbi:MAG: MBOAT family protein [Opitutaceae bacterium]|nr:MBOAT family protein [Opitutaceae bacterium]
MVFSSVIFLFYFLPLVLGVALLVQHWLNRAAGRGIALEISNAWLFLASIAFYAWGEVRLVWILGLSGLLSFVGGLLVERFQGRPRLMVLTGVVAANLALLAWFKYAPLAADLLAWLNHLVGRPPTPDPTWSRVALPLGISFFTFHGLSYVVDVYRRKIAATRRPLDFACYFTLFPQLVAGPIVRFSEVAEFFERRVVAFEDVADGARRFIIGLGKKVLIANQVAVLADAAFALPAVDVSPASAWLGTAAYALQIYFDFSGYSDMALGLGRMLGFKFPENFNHPYVATSVRDFWRRWHMTLSRFFRDYLYIPLGGNRAGAPRTALNLLLVFALCGLWHGASWNFLFWGLFHGAFLALERLFGTSLDRPTAWVRTLGRIYTLAVVLFAWVLFRCDTWPQAVSVWNAMLGRGAATGITMLPWKALAPDVMLALAAGVLFSMPISSWVRERCARISIGSTLLPPVATMAALMVLALSLLAVGAGSHNPFIYYRF